MSFWEGKGGIWTQNQNLHLHLETWNPQGRESQAWHHPEPSTSFSAASPFWSLLESSKFAGQNLPALLSRALNHVIWMKPWNCDFIFLYLASEWSVRTSAPLLMAAFTFNPQALTSVFPPVPISWTAHRFRPLGRRALHLTQLHSTREMCSYSWSSSGSGTRLVSVVESLMKGPSAASMSLKLMSELAQHIQFPYCLVEALGNIFPCSWTALSQSPGASEVQPHLCSFDFPSYCIGRRQQHFPNAGAEKLALVLVLKRAQQKAQRETTHFQASWYSLTEGIRSADLTWRRVCWAVCVILGVHWNGFCQLVYE